MRVLMISKALVVGAYQRKLEELAALPDVTLTVAVPPYWREQGQDIRLERVFCQGYTLKVLPMRLNGHYHLHYYPQLGRLLDGIRPDILHFDEEPYNLATWLALGLASRRRIPFVCFSWQNIMQQYPPPFRWLETNVLRRSALAIAGNQDAAAILRRKGYRGPEVVIPQFGIDPDLFAPVDPDALQRGRPFTVGFVAGKGRLIEAKGLSVLLEALAGLGGDWRLEVTGSGPAKSACEAQARTLGIAGRVAFRGLVTSTEIPAVLRGFDVLAGPSLTDRRWKEQFGRMLVEAMACQVAVVGSDSGEIPQVIGDAGLVTPEGDVLALRAALARLRDDPVLRASLARAGRQQVLERYTQAAVAARTAAAYRAVLGLSAPTSADGSGFSSKALAAPPHLAPRSAHPC